MSAVYLINGSTPEELGVRVARRTLVNQGVDTLSLQVDRGVDGVVPFAYDEVVAVTRDGVPFFRGRVMTRVVRGEPVSEDMSIEIGGPWWEMSRLPFIIVRGSEKTNRYRQGVSAGEGQSSLQIFQQVMDYALAKGLSLQLSTFTLDTYEPPVSIKLNRHVDELVRMALSGHPDVVLWWDYSTTPPTANLTKRGDEDTVLTYAVGTPPLAAATLVPRPDLVPSGVVVRYERAEITPDAEGTRPAFLIDEYPPESEPDVLDAIAMTIVVRRGETRIAGFAQRYYEAYATLPWEGRITLQAEDCVSGIRPGQSINITGGQAAWGTMQAFVQRVQENLMSGRTDITLGLPQYYGERPTRSRLNHWTRDDQFKDSVAAAEDTIIEAEPQGNLMPYVDDIDTVAGSCQLRCSPGAVSIQYSGGSGDETEPEFEGVPLDTEPLPGVTVARGGSMVELWLQIEVSPTMTEHAFTDTLGEAVTEYRPGSPMTIVEATIETDAGDARPWELDYEDGTVTETAILCVKLGSAIWLTGTEAPTVDVRNAANISLVFLPPGGFIKVLA